MADLPSVPSSGVPHALGTAGAREGEQAAAARLATSSPTSALDRLVGLASRLLGTPSAQLSLLSDVQLVAGGVGDAASGTLGPLADSLCTVTAHGGAPLLVVDAAHDPRVAALPPVTSGTVGAYLGVPLRGRDGHVVGALCAFTRDPRPWSASDVRVLTELADAAAAELELAALQAEFEIHRLRWELSMAAGGVGSFDVELGTGHLVRDDRLLEIFGQDPGTFDGTLATLSSRVHPDDVERVVEAARDALARCSELEAEFRVVLPDGGARWVLARGTVLPGPDGQPARLLGAVFDTTARREADARLGRVLETMSAAFCSFDREWRFTYVNAEAEHLLGMRRDDLLGNDVWELVPATRDSPFESRCREAARTGEAAVFEMSHPMPAEGWFEVRVWPSPDGVSVHVHDVTARRAAQDAAEAATRRLELLSQVSAELSGTLDAETAVAQLGRHVVPALADWCIVTLLDEHGTLRDVGSRHVDDAMLPTLERYSRLRIAALDPASFVARAVATGEPVLVPPPATPAIAAVLHSAEARRLVADLAPHSAAALPLRARGRTSGLITLFRGPGRPPLAGEDLLTAVEVTGRAALALDNARLYGAQQSIAEGLQRNLLTPPVAPAHAQVAVRYRPAAEAARVGGDWYDTFRQRDGATVLVIGDVVGHDIHAAAAMSQVRSLLRGIGYTTGGGPAAILTDLDGALAGLAVDTAATAVVARLDHAPAATPAGVGNPGAPAGAPTRLTWSNAGHPPPMLLDPDGKVTELAGLRNDLLLGVQPAWQRVEQEIELTAGSTVLLYTDGLVERRGESLQSGLDRLREAIAGLADADLDDLVDRVLDQVLGGPAGDDVALVAVRLAAAPGTQA